MKEEPFNWELYSQNPDKYTVYTRGGVPVARITLHPDYDSVDYPLDYPLMTTLCDGTTLTNKLSGIWDVDSDNHRSDLVKMVSEEPKTKTVEQWDEDFEHRYIPVFLVNEPGQKYRVTSLPLSVYTDPLKALERGKKYENAVNEFLCVINLAEHPQVKAILESKKLVEHIPKSDE